jgi:hypothetical protein
MKSKIVISILLAVLMLGTLATPVLAGRPYKVTLEAYSPEPVDTVIAKCALQVAHDNDVTVTISLRGATPDCEYWVILIDHTGLAEYLVGTLETNSRGNGRFHGKICETFDAPPYSRELEVAVRYMGSPRFDASFGVVDFNS